LKYFSTVFYITLLI